MGTTASDLERGRDALARYAWQEAFDALAAAQTDDPPDAEALDGLAEATWWLGRADESRATRERAYAAFEGAGDRRRAARCAAWLHDRYQTAGKIAVANGWAERARRLLDGLPECAEHGLVKMMEVEAAHERGDLTSAAELATEVVDAGRRLPDADVEASGLQALGHIRVAQGRVAEGFVAFDEAMLLAIEGKLGQFTTGSVYCSAISACNEAGDLRRAAEWAEVGVTWSDLHPLTGYPGLCRVHRAGVLDHRGAWAEAEQEARRAYDALLGMSAPAAAMAYLEVGEIRRRLGDLDGAEAAFRRVEELGSRPQPGLALVRLAQGKVDIAATAIARALAEETHNRPARAKMLPAQIQIALAAGDIAIATAAVDELVALAHEYGTSGLRATAAVAQGRLELAAGAESAGQTLRRALQEWLALDVPYEVASTRLLMGLACRAAGDEEGARSSFEAAAAIFGALGAALDARRIDELRASRSVLPAGLSAREAEVLRLVASGHANKTIAAELGLSPKTVDRHLSNIFTKTGVASRTAAAAFAFQHGMTVHG